MKTKIEAYKCPCGGKIVKCLAFDGEQAGEGHEYIWVCRKDGKSYGESWVTRIWGVSEPETILPFEPWVDAEPLSLTRQMLRPRPTAWGAALLKGGVAASIAYVIVVMLLNVGHVKLAALLTGTLI